MSAYRIGEHVYATAAADWELAGYVMVHNGPITYAAMKYETRILVSLQDEGGALTVLAGEEPRGIDYEFSGRQGGKWSNSESSKRAIARAVPLEAAVREELARLVENLLPPGPQGSYYPPIDTAWSTLKPGRRPL
ncbi:hypothetical protein ACFWSF_39480 [Streptomyces sp. NPDC058611]|uniref:hypothetical protein n=1 Tax=unclassified Streptomyces TaxID=2593676 RepID=UPI0036484A1C